MRPKDDQKWEIPERFRASLDMSDEDAYALLKAADEEQKKLGKRINSPFERVSPQGMQRSKAYVTVRTLLEAQGFMKLTKDQIEQLAEAWATVGRYDIASKISKQHRKRYAAKWKAVYLPDDQWCNHPSQHTYISEYIFSAREQREVPLLKCNICGMMNVLDAPKEVADRVTRQASHQGKTRGMSIDQAKAYHSSEVKKG